MIISILKKTKEFIIDGIVDIEEKVGNEILGVEIKYSDSQLEKIRENGVKYAFVSLGSVGNPKNRIVKFEQLKCLEYELPVLISAQSIIAEDVFIGEGSVVMPGAVLNPGVRIGKNCIINTGAIVDHDCIIGDHVHIAPGVTMSGSVKIGNRTHIGTGANIIQNISVGENCIVGAGALVIRNVEDGKKVMGVPAK